MAKELENEQSVLLVQNEKNDELEVVSKGSEKGELKTSQPKQQNESEFLKIDKHGDILDNFLKNYFAQAKNPKHTGFYLVAMEGIEKTVQAIKGLLQSGEEGREFLSDYKVDTSNYLQRESPTTETQSQNSVDNINWDMFAKIGITREALEKSGSLDEMLNYRRSSNLHTITIKVDDLSLTTDARLSLRRGADNKLMPVIHAVRQQPQLDRPFYGNTFTASDKENLRKTGNLGRQIEITNRQTGEVTKSYVSIDSKTNELIAYNAKNARIPTEIKGVTLTDEQRSQLKEGRGVLIEGMTSKAGKEFSATVQISAMERGLTFRFDESQRQSQSQREVSIPTKLGGVELTEEQRSTLQSGKTTYIEGLTDKQGKSYNAYVKMNEEQGKLNFYKWNPDKKESQDREQTQNQESQGSQQRGRKV